MFRLYGGSIAEIATPREHTMALLYGGHPLPLGLQARCLFRKLGTSSWRGKCHAREGGHPATLALTPWIPAYAGMTQPPRDPTDWQCIYEMDI
jgi:hypothetical protein